MGFMDRARQLTERGQQKMDEAQTKFNDRQACAIIPAP